MAVSEDELANWKGQASDAEQERYERCAARRDWVIRSSDAWRDARLKAYAKGSYPNFTNVVRDAMWRWG